MGLFSFIKEAGEKLFGGKEVEAAAAQAASITLSGRIAGEASAVVVTHNGDGSGVAVTETTAAAAGHAAYISSISGSIFNAAPVGTSNVSGGKVFLFAAVDIGQVDNPIQTRIGTLQGKLLIQSPLDPRPRRLSEPVESGVAPAQAVEQSHCGGTSVRRPASRSCSTS